MENLFEDPSMKDLVIDFCDESEDLISQLEAILEVLEVNLQEKSKLEDFGQIIDRIMGAARSLSLEEIANFCELGKAIGYQSGQTEDDKLLNVVVAILFDTTYLLSKMIESLRTGNSSALKNLNTKAFVTRLNWLSEKFKHIERKSCAISTEENEQLSQSSIDDLMKSLGL